MPDLHLLHQRLLGAADRQPQRLSLIDGAHSLSYADLASRMQGFGAGLRGLGLARADRVGIYPDLPRQASVVAWHALLDSPPADGHRVIDVTCRSSSTHPAVRVDLRAWCGPMTRNTQSFLPARCCRPSCSSTVWTSDLPVAQVGDLMVVCQSGAYGASASPQAILGHPACVEVLVWPSTS